MSYLIWFLVSLGEIIYNKEDIRKKISIDSEQNHKIHHFSNIKSFLSKTFKISYIWYLMIP